MNLTWRGQGWACVLMAKPLLAQRSGEAEACAACGSLFGGMIFLVVALIALNIALLVWVARDAKARGMDSAILWMLLVFFTGIFGLVNDHLKSPFFEHLAQYSSLKNIIEL